jgi:acetyl esterase/lipase
MRLRLPSQPTRYPARGSGPQIRCGNVELTTHNDVRYDTKRSGQLWIPLTLGVQVSRTAGSKPLVVYISGGEFRSNDKAPSLHRRTYVVEQVYVVASIEYRTLLSGATSRDSLADVKSAIR